MSDQQRTVTVTWGEAVVSPKQYHSYRVGPFTATETVAPGETIDAALERAQRALNGHAARMVKAAREFWTREWHLKGEREEE